MYVFQIGFNKCGTVSLHDYFQKNKINSYHWELFTNPHWPFNKSYIADVMYDNILNNRKVFFNIIKYQEENIFLSDMENFITIKNSRVLFTGYTFFKTMYEQYPGSKFIFNTRNIDDWIASRVKHNNGAYLEEWCISYNKTKKQIIDLWANHYHSHTENVNNFFSDKQDNILYFNLNKSNHKDLFKFLNKSFLHLNKNIIFEQHNKTT